MYLCVYLWLQFTNTKKIITFKIYMQTINYPIKEEYTGIIARPIMDTAEIQAKVKPIIEAVRTQGDEALKRYALQFDGAVIDDILTSSYEIAQAEKHLDETLKTAIKVAYSNIEKFHILQKDIVRKVETMPGVLCWRKSVAIDKVGLYIPGGTAPLFSTVLMLGIPAKLAGCSEIVLCTPPNAEGRIHPAILFAAHLVGITKIYKVGGAQAIAAMAYGTKTIPQVYKIFGPGNQYVTAAKQLLLAAGIVAIDMPAGPSEVAVYADETSYPQFVAADLLSQAEHGSDSQVLLVSTSPEMIAMIQKEVEEQLKTLPRMAFAAISLQNSKAVLVKDVQEAIELLNEYAAEHLILATDYADEISEKIHNAGSIFLGHFTPEAVGDYASGTNHTLPTNGYAKAYSGVSLDSFIKKITFQRLTQSGIQLLGNTVETMAAAESLDAHRLAVTYRLAEIAKK
jgi:histidinol dehydrogenase